MYVLPDAEFSGSSSKAIDAKTQLDNQLGGSSITDIPKGITDAIGCFSAQTRAKDKAANRFYLVSMANSGPGGQVSAAAEYKYLPIGRDKDEEDCAKVFGIPNMTKWCPLTLMDVGSLGNYYNQQVLETVYTQMGTAAGKDLDFPNAICAQHLPVAPAFLPRAFFS